MKTSWNKTQRTERYLFKKLSPEHSLVFQAGLLTDPLLRMQLFYQKKVYALLLLYQRKKLKKEAEEAHERLFSDPNKTHFKQSVLSLFNP